MSIESSKEIFNWELDPEYTNNGVLASWHGEDEMEPVLSGTTYEWILDKSEIEKIGVHPAIADTIEPIPEAKETLRFMHPLDKYGYGTAVAFIPASKLGNVVNNSGLPEKVAPFAVFAASAAVCFATRPA